MNSRICHRNIELSSRVCDLRNSTGDRSHHYGHPVDLVDGVPRETGTMYKGTADENRRFDKLNEAPHHIVVLTFKGKKCYKKQEKRWRSTDMPMEASLELSPRVSCDPQQVQSFPPKSNTSISPHLRSTSHTPKMIALYLQTSDAHGFLGNAAMRVSSMATPDIDASFDFSLFNIGWKDIAVRDHVTTNSQVCCRVAVKHTLETFQRT